MKVFTKGERMGLTLKLKEFLLITTSYPTFVVLTHTNSSPVPP